MEGWCDDEFIEEELIESGVIVDEEDDEND